MADEPLREDPVAKFLSSLEVVREVKELQGETRAE